jgi:hypothetical protein
MIETVATGVAGRGGSTEGIRPLGRKGHSSDNAGRISGSTRVHRGPPMYNERVDRHEPR